MSASLAVALPGNATLVKRLTALTRRAEDWTAVWPEITAAFVHEEAEQWTTQGRGSWPDLLQSTEDRKQAGGWGNEPMLVREGTLRGSFTGGGSIAITPSKWQYTSSVPYARFHQTGTPRMAMRKVVDLSPALVADWMKILQAHLSTGTMVAG